MSNSALSFRERFTHKPIMLINVGFSWFPAREDIPTSRKECLDTENGIYYEGTKSTTASGKTCMKWSLLRIREEKNYCRNRLGKWEKPGCYVLVGKHTVALQLCDIPMCCKSLD